jgi:hypothetical protein
MSTSSCATEFESLPGLSHAKNAVQRALSSGSGVHAVLFYGPEGAGKGRLARFLASSWMCLTPVEGMACGECNVCRSFAAGRAVDFQLVKPWGPSNLIKFSSLKLASGIEQDSDRPPIIPLFDFFRTRPLMAKCKVVLFEDVHRMTNDTANAFLKTLEEPNPTSKIILTTDEFSRVLPTVRSRCMCVACELPPRGDATTGGSSVESVFGGSPGGVELVRKHPEVFGRLHGLLEDSRQAPWGAAFKLAEEARGVAEDYAKATGLGARAANTKILESIGAWLAQERPDRPELMFSLAKAHRQVQGNVNAGTAFESLFLDLLYHG